MLSIRELLPAIPSIDLSLMSVRNLCFEAGCLDLDGLSFFRFLLSHGLMVDGLKA